jgi:hypothetical protein
MKSQAAQQNQTNSNLIASQLQCNEAYIREQVTMRKEEAEVRKEDADARWEQAAQFTQLLSLFVKTPECCSCQSQPLLDRKHNTRRWTLHQCGTHPINQCIRTQTATSTITGPAVRSSSRDPQQANGHYNINSSTPQRTLPPLHHQQAHRKTTQHTITRADASQLTMLLKQPRQPLQQPQQRSMKQPP